MLGSGASLCFGMPKTNLLSTSDGRRKESSRWSDIEILIEKFMNQNKIDKKKGGRPKKKLGEKKTYRINTKLGTGDYYSLLAKVRKAGTTTSEFVRACLKKGYIKERLSVEQADFIRKLCGMANNLNQLAYQANVQGYSSVASRCQILADDMDAVVKMIRK